MLPSMTTLGLVFNKKAVFCHCEHKQAENPWHDWGNLLGKLTLPFLLLPMMSLLYSQCHVGCSWLGSRILMFVFSSSECSYSVVILESCQAFPEKSKQKGNARISDSLRISSTKMEIHGKNKRYFCSLWLSVQWISKTCSFRNDFYLSILTALICGFSLDPLNI